MTRDDSKSGPAMAAPFQWSLAALETLMAEDQMDQHAAVLRAFSVVELWRLRRVCRAFHRWGTAALAALPRVVAVGGSDADNDDTASVEVLDLSTLRWSSGVVPALPEPRGWHGACGFGDGRVVVAGGLRGEDDETMRTALQWASLDGDARVSRFSEGMFSPLGTFSTFWRGAFVAVVIGIAPLVGTPAFANTTCCCNSWAFFCNSAYLRWASLFSSSSVAMRLCITSRSPLTSSRNAAKSASIAPCNLATKSTLRSLSSKILLAPSSGVLIIRYWCPCAQVPGSRCRE